MNPLSSVAALNHAVPSQFSDVPPAIKNLPEGLPIPLPETPSINPSLRTLPNPGPASGARFDQFLQPLIQDVEAKQTAAADAVGGLLAGEKVPLHQAVIAMEESSVSFQMMVEIRNRLLEAYQELMRMQL